MTGRDVTGRPLVAGVDGCRAGWVVVTAPAVQRDDRDDAAAIEVVAGFDAIARRLADGDLALVAVDMPIGLPERGARACDRAARRALGPRRSSVFPTPIRALVGSTDYAAALATARRLDNGRGLSRQAFNLLPAIAEVDRAARALGPGQPARLVEVSPELSFARLGGGPMPDPKRTDAGRRRRRELLLRHVAGVRRILEAPAPRGAAADDVADACAALWSARRVLAGVAERFGDDERDAHSLPMVVWA